MKSTLFLSTIAKAINRILQLDPESAERLQRLAGKMITIELLPFHYVFHCVFSANGVTIQHTSAEPAETTIRGTPLQMMNVVLAKENRHTFFADDLVIEGNAELGQDVIQLLDSLEIDWEEHLSQLVGDVPAYHVGRFVRKVNVWLNKVQKSFNQNVSDYVHEEKTWFPSKEALKDFFTDIDTLRMDVDRMAARIQNLTAHLDADEVTK